MMMMMMMMMMMSFTYVYNIYIYIYIIYYIWPWIVMNIMLIRRVTKPCVRPRSEAMRLVAFRREGLPFPIV